MNTVLFQTFFNYCLIKLPFVLHKETRKSFYVSKLIYKLWFEEPFIHDDFKSDRYVFNIETSSTESMKL